MSPISQASLLLINTIGGFFLLVVILRFLLQLVRADFYNPLSQFIVKATNPVLIPLRRIIPGFAGLDVASLILAYAIQVGVMAVIFWLSFAFIPWGNILLWAPLALVSLLLNIYFWGLIIMVVASWIAPNSYNPALILINQILEPVMRPIRNLLPNLGGIDFSPIAIFLAIQMIEILVLGPIAQALNLPRGLVMVL